MSKSVDERVVSMKFDNGQFENGVRQTMGTLDRLKSKLNLSDASKGIEQISVKFSALQAIGTGALMSVGNAAFNAGKRMIESISGIKAAMAGFDEYSMTMNTIQTLVNSTGKSISEIETKLEELDDYADKTVYSTADMFNNIYKFTNAGVDLDTAKRAMIGIANATAYAGQGAQQASIAYYNLAQSISMGYLTTIDYKSINLANIATKDFKERLAETAVELGTLKKTADGLYSTGKKTYTLQALFAEGLSDRWATTDVMMKVFDTYGSMETEIGQKAWKAAQEVKTFGMMMESLKAQAGTGWKNTWQILFGGLDDAKRVWTGLSLFIGDIINYISRYRNAILKVALDNPFKKILDKINNNEAVKSFKELNDKVKQTSKTLEEYKNIVTKIWRGDYKNQPYRKALVEEAGYNYEVAQSLVNLTDKMAGYGKGWTVIDKITEEDVIAAEKKYGVQLEQNEETIEKQTNAIQELTDERLEQLGLTKSEILMYRQLEKGAKKYGMSIEELVETMSSATGRDLLYGSADGNIIGVFQHLSQALKNIFNTIKTAWTDVFEGITGIDLYFVILKLNKFAESIRKLTENEEKMRKLSQTLRGIFSVIHLAATAVNIVLKVLLQVLKGIFTALGFGADGLLDITSSIGNAIYAFDRFITKSEFVTKAVEAITSVIFTAIKTVKDWITNNEKIMSVLDSVKTKFNQTKEAIKLWFEGLKETDDIPKYIFGGLIEGFKKYWPNVKSAITNFCTNFIDLIKGLLGIHSPSTVMFAIGGFLISGLIGGILASSTSAFDTIKSFGLKLVEAFKSINFGSLFAAGMGISIVYLLKRSFDMIDAISTPLQGVYNLLTSLGTAATDFGKAQKMKSVSEIIKSIAISIGILVASLWLLSKIDTKDLIKAGIALGAIIVAFGVFVAILAKASNTLTNINNLNTAKIIGIILSLSLGMYIIAKAMMKLSNLSIEQLTIASGALTVITICLMGLIGTIAVASELLKNTNNIQKITKLFRTLAVSILLISVALLIIKNVDWESIGKFSTVMAEIVGVFGAFLLFRKIAKTDMDKASETIMSIAVSMLLLTIVMKLAGTLDPHDFHNGLAVILIFSSLLLAIMGISKIFSSTEMIKVTGSLMMVVVAMGLMVAVMKMTSSMDWTTIGKGILVVTVLTSIIVGIIALLSLLKSVPKGGLSVLLGITAVLAAMTIVVWLLGQIENEKLAKGIVAVTALSACISILLLAAKNFSADMSAIKTLTKITVLLVVLVLSIIALTFIDTTKLLTSVGSLVSVMGMLAILLKSVDNMKINKGTLVTLLAMTLVMSAMTGLIILLSKVTDTRQAIEAAISLSILMIASAAVLAILSKIKINIKDAAISILALTAMAIPLLAFVGVLALMNNVSNAAENAMTLIKLSAACALLALALSVLGLLLSGPQAIGIAVGITALLAMAIPLLAFVGILYLMSGIEKAESNANLLISLMEQMVKMFAILAILSPLSLGAIIAVGSLELCIASIASFAMAIGALDNKFPKLKDFINRGLPILEKLSYSLGTIFGNIISGFANSIANGLPNIGLQLSEFAKNIEPFINIMSNIDNSFAGNLNSVISSILKLIGAEFLDKIVNFMTGNKLDGDTSAIVTFSNDLKNVSGNLAEFINKLSSAGNGNLDKVNSFIEILSKLMESNSKLSRIGGIHGFIFGNNNLIDFINGLGEVASPLEEFINKIKAVSGDTSDETINKANNVIGILSSIVDLNNSLVEKGGVKQWFTGTKDIGAFVTSIKNDVAPNLSTFVSTMSGIFDEDSSNNIDNVNLAIDILSKMIGLLGALDGEFGLLQGATGSKMYALKDLANNLYGIGVQLSNFITTINNNVPKNVNLDSVTTAIDVLSRMVTIINSFETEGGLSQGMMGSKLSALKGLATNLEAIATQLAAFVKTINIYLPKGTNLEDAKTKIDVVFLVLEKMANVINSLEGIGIKQSFTGTKVAEFGYMILMLGGLAEQMKIFMGVINQIAIDENTVLRIKIISTILSSLSEIGTSEHLGDNINSLKDAKKVADGIKDFIDKISEISDDNITSVKSKIDTIVAMIKTLSEDINTETLNNLKTSLSDLGKDGINGFISSLNDETLLDRAKTTIKDMIQAVIDAAGTKIVDIKNKFNEIGEEAYQGLNWDGNRGKFRYFSFEELGKNFVQGFANGITSNKYLAGNAGTDLGTYALNKAKESIDSNSPSKETYKLGSYFGEGFAIGILEYKSRVGDAADKLGVYAKNSLSGAIAQAELIASSDIEYSPTIRPVLDLSNIENGNKYLNSMFSNPVYSVDSNLAAISTGMNNRLQNKNNNDIVSAINSLSNNMGSSGDTYNINGINYSSDEEISGAIKTLVGAVVNKRRI